MTATLLVCACGSGANTPDTGYGPTISDPARGLQSASAESLDMREANVLAVSFESLEPNSFRFDVTLQHDDEGEAPDFADAWVVEDLQGNRLGMRELLHSHDNQPFTRSATIEVPTGIERVLVRGRDMRHGFGGQAMLVNLESRETQPVQDQDE